VNNEHATVDASGRMGCGVCKSKCLEGAITLVHDPAKGKPLEIQKLIAQAASSIEN
jgi:ferredoxin